MGMPSAAGLFHRAAAQSGGGGNIPGSDLSRELARQIMKELGLGANDIASLKKMDWARLNAAGNAAVAKMNPAGGGAAGPGGTPTMTPRAGFSPTVDGRTVTLRSFYEVAPDLSRNVPMMIGNVSEEGNRMASRPREAEWHDAVAKVWGESKASALIATMKKKYPEKSVLLLSYGVNGVNSRNNVQRMVKLKYKQKEAPVYQYYFTWPSPMLEDAGAWHTAGLALCFDNTKRCEQGTGNTPEAQALAKKMATAWVSFARTGNPSQPGLVWAPSDAARCQPMVFDNRCRMVDDPDGDLRRILIP